MAHPRQRKRTKEQKVDNNNDADDDNDDDNVKGRKQSLAKNNSNRVSKSGIKTSSSSSTTTNRITVRGGIDGGGATTTKSTTSPSYNKFVVIANVLLAATGIAVFSFTMLTVRTQARSRTGSGSSKTTNINNKQFDEAATSQSSKRITIDTTTTATSTTTKSNTKNKPDTSATREKTTPLLTLLGTFEIQQVVPHDPKAFTQGLALLNTNNNKKSYFVEGTGMNGQSDVRLVDIESGNVLQRHSLSNEYFGEGITTYDVISTDKNTNQQYKQKQRIIQITWQEKTAFLYDIIHDDNNIDIPIISKSFHSFNFTTTTTKEGWGITFRPDEHVFYVTDGSPNIHVWDATTFEQIRIIPVTFTRRVPPKNRTDKGSTFTGPAHHLNEIEWDPSTKTILANVWYQDIIIRIDPVSGHVIRLYNLQSLYTNRPSSVDCLNGIALSSKSADEVWVTGKWWPNMYRIKLDDDTTATL